MSISQDLKKVITGDLHPRSAARRTGLTVANVTNLVRMVERSGDAFGECDGHPSVRREDVTALCVTCERPFSGTLCPVCHTEHEPLTEWAPVPVGACGSYYPHALDGCVVACGAPAGHVDDHEARDAYGETRAWAQA